MTECPMCGSRNIEVSTASRSIAVPLANTAYFGEDVYTCRTCGADWCGESGVMAAIEQVEKESVPVMIEMLEKKGITNAAMERMLGLPQRTLARWKQGECSKAAVILLRMLVTFPWLLSVADGNYDPKLAKKYVR